MCRLALDKDPEYVRALVLMGRILLLKHANEEAIEYFECAISKVWIPSCFHYFFSFVMLVSSALSCICYFELLCFALFFFFFNFYCYRKICLISLSLCLQLLIIFWFFISFLLLDIQLMRKNWTFWFFHPSGLELLVNDRLNTYFNMFFEQTFFWTGFWIYVENQFGYAFGGGIFR